MDLQNTFYVIGIICMTLYTLLLIAIVIMLFVITKKLTLIYKTIEEKIATIQDAMEHPKRAAQSVGAAVADVALEQAGKLLRSQKKKR